MKKIFTILFALCLVVGTAGMVMAHGNGNGINNGNGHGYDNGPGMGPGNGNGYGHNGGNGDGPCSGPNCTGMGNFDIEASSFGAGLDCDFMLIPNGIAGGISGAVGGANAGAHGFTFDGSAEGEVTTVGGGLTDTDAYWFHPDLGDLSIGIGSSSFNQAVTGATLKVKADPDPLFGYSTAGGMISGFAAQGSLDGSYLGESFFFSGTGDTFGIAGQGSVGGFHGYAYASDFGDLPFCFYDSKAGAGAGALIDMTGYSYSESYRWVDWDDGVKTEGMGTNVGAGTNVETSGYAYDWDRGLFATSDAGINGGFTAIGGAMTSTSQNAPGIGGANAMAAGMYTGSGSLGCNFTGAVTGYTHTSVTTVNGMNGSINTSGAGMSVTATTSTNR